MEGKTIIVKTFGLSQMIYNMQSYKIEQDELVKVERIIFKFLWSNSEVQNGVDRIKRSIMKNDYSKGNRLYNFKNFFIFPKTRLFGNLALSLITKFSTGYWNILDPCNGYTAIRADIFKKIKIEKISNDFFFETSMLFELSMIEATVIDVPMKPKYFDKQSSLKIYKIIPNFLFMHLFYFFKRIYFTYYCSKKTFASLVFAAVLVLFSINVIYFFYCYNLSLNNDIISIPTLKILKMSFYLSIIFLILFIYMDIKSYFFKLIKKRSLNK
jgi:hypothetical protein